MDRNEVVLPEKGHSKSSNALNRSQSHPKKSGEQRIVRKEMYSINDPKLGQIGPFNISTLDYLVRSGFIEKDLFVYEQTSNTTAYSLLSLLTEKASLINSEEVSYDMFNWESSLVPYTQINSHISKCFEKRQSLTALEIQSLSMSGILSLGKITEFDGFLEQNESIPEEIRELQLNYLSEPFACWIYKTMIAIDSTITPQETKELLLMTCPSDVRTFFSNRISNNETLNRVINSFNQWRIYIPVFSNA